MSFANRRHEIYLLLRVIPHPNNFITNIIRWSDSSACPTEGSVSASASFGRKIEVRPVSVPAIIRPNISARAKLIFELLQIVRLILGERNYVLLVISVKRY